MTDKDLTVKNGIVMLRDLHKHLDLKLTEDDASHLWEGLTIGEKEAVYTRHQILLGVSKHI